MMFTLPESPLWHSPTNSWWWVDILEKALVTHKIDGCGNVQYKYLEQQQMVANIVSVSMSTLLVCEESVVGLVNIETNEYESIAVLDHGEELRCNDGSIGPDGKFWFGTMEKQPTGLNGDLYSLDKNGRLIRQDVVIGIPNTFVWISEHEVLISDSFLQKTYKVELQANGMLDWKKRQLWLDLSGTNMTPDGGVIDADGNIWIAIWGGAAIHKYNVKGQLLDKIELNALQPSSCAFGGTDMDELMITTASVGMTPEALDAYPDSGKIIVQKMHIKGQASKKFELRA